MLAVRLHGPKDLHLDDIPGPPSPAPGQALLHIKSVGICGSDLHSYLDARIGDIALDKPLILGHEFSASVDAVGPASYDGFNQPLNPGRRVAVDPAQTCGRCEYCQRGDPNFCAHLVFCGLHPHDGALCQQMLVPSRTCFPIPQTINDAEGALLEPLGVAMHAVDLCHLRAGRSLAVIGVGPIGLCIVQLARLCGADPVYAIDRLPWRLELAGRFGAIPLDISDASPQKLIAAMRGRGVDTAIEAAWSGDALTLAIELLHPGGRLAVIGIPSDDQVQFRHSTARRKGLSILMVRRMKHTYPRAIHLVEQGRIDLKSLISHRVPLEQAPRAFELNAAYRDRVVKMIVDV